MVAGGPHDGAGHPTAADLVIEVADSSLEFDTTQKRMLHARAGIREDWVVDVSGGRSLVFRDPRAGDSANRLAVGPADVIHPLALPAASVRGADLPV